MHNIQFIRKSPELFDNAMVKRGLGPLSQDILERDKELRGDKTQLQQLQQQANEWAKKIGELKSKGQDATEAMTKSKELKQQIAALKDKQENETDEVSVELMDELLYTLPNILADDVPTGDSEEDNVEVKRIGEIPNFNFTVKEHDVLGEALGLMDFKQASKMSGSRFVILRGALARLERALCQFMIDIHTREFGYEETSIPLLVKDEAMFGSGQLPKFSEDSFVTTNGYRLIPTSEVSLVNIVNDRILEYTELPIRLTACSPCFRSEAGSAGRDTRGMIRQHQFIKVELVSIVEPEDSEAEHQRMLGCAEEILKRLELPYRVVLLCSGDTGFCAQKTYDLEVWMPGQNKYREISSCSNCGDFQARRLKARYRASEKENAYVHTLNGSGVAVGRALVAILENYQNQDGSITIPKQLIPYMDGVTKIG
jgi:seryl-tRNA synthetase